MCAALSLEPLSALRPLRECVWVTCVGFCRSLTERIFRRGVKSTKFAIAGSKRKKKIYRNLSHTSRNYGLEISYGSHSKLWDTPRGGEAGVGGFRVGDRQCVSEVRWSHSISTVLAIMWWLVSSCNISLKKIRIWLELGGGLDFDLINFLVMNVYFGAFSLFMFYLNIKKYLTSSFI